MRKKFIYILALTALMCSCVKETPAPAPVNLEDEIGLERDGKVTLGFNVDLGEGMNDGTKALADGPDIQNIYVAVFDAAGYKLSEYVKANPITTGPENNHKYQFTIQLKVSDKPRTLHFIANGPKELRFGTEQEVIGELYTRYDADESDEYTRKDAYWQRLTFKKISPRPVTSDPDSLAAYNSMVETLSNLKLIRNFSKVTIFKRATVAEDSEEFKNFKILGMWFVNYPDRGSVAPYNRKTGGFGTDTSKVDNKRLYLDYNNMADVEDPEQGNYQGFTLASTDFITPEVFDNSNMIAAASNTASGYVYEREKALKFPMYLILKCEYGGAETYYKIAMQDQDGNFYAMLRNFNYNVQIQNVSAPGHSTAAEALASTPTGDISLNVDYQDLPNISDGNARITVNATKMIIVGQEGYTTTAKFWYRYEPDISGHEFTGVHNDLEKSDDEWNHAHPHVSINYEGSEGSTGAVIGGLDVATSDEGGNRYVTINTTAASATPKTQTITIEGRNWDGSRYKTITRTIQLVLRNALDLSLKASPNTDSDNAANVLAQKNQPVVLHLGIDQDLPSSMFPLYFKLDPSANSLTPDNDHSDEQELPARSGTDASGHPAYWFEKAVSWTEYENAPVVDGKKEIKVYFKTILADNATSVEVSNEYFATATAQVKNYTAKTFSNLTFSGSTHKVGVEETFSFNMSETPSSGKVTVAMKGVEPASLTGFTYKGKDFEGYWLYERSVSGTSDNFSIVPYQEGNVSIKLSAFLFNDATESAFVIPSVIPVGTVIFNDTFGSTNVSIINYNGAGITSDFNKSGVSYSLTGTYTNIGTNSETNMTSGHIRYSSSSRNDINTVIISNIQAYGVKKFTLSFKGYISNTSRVSGTYSVNGGSSQSISSGSNSLDFELGTDVQTITISFVIRHADSGRTGTLGIDDVKLTVR